LAAHSNSAWASDHFLVTDTTVPPLPAEEEVAVQKKVKEFKATVSYSAKKEWGVDIFYCTRTKREVSGYKAESQCTKLEQT